MVISRKLNYRLLFSTRIQEENNITGNCLLKKAEVKFVDFKYTTTQARCTMDALQAKCCPESTESDMPNTIKSMGRSARNALLFFLI